MKITYILPLLKSILSTVHDITGSKILPGIGIAPLSLSFNRVAIIVVFSIEIAFLSCWLISQ